MKQQMATHAISLALGILLAAAGWHVLTWQFWAWIFPLHGLLMLRDSAVRSNGQDHRLAAPADSPRGSRC